MAEQHSAEGGASSSETPTGGMNSDSIVKLNVKTLDSRVFSFDVNKSMPVSLLKEKITSEMGLPVVQQRLIFRGKVLKDEHLFSEYHVEDGDTLHLVERQSFQAQSSSSSGNASSETNANTNGQGNDANAGVPRNRLGQISHSVVLGTFNMGEQGEGIVPDLTRVLGAVLNSLGVSNQPTTNVGVGPQNSVLGGSGQTTQISNAEGVSVNVGNQSQAGNQAQSGQPFPSQPFQFPVGAASIPIPTLHSPIPDSLNTLSEFMNRMEAVLSQNEHGSNSAANGGAGQPSVQLPVNGRGLPTLEALNIVLRQAEHLLGGGAANALSRIAGRMEQEGASTDPLIRSQVQGEAVQVGLAMQHLGALFLELGRTILTLRVGQSAAESVINAGPAVYISPSGPNPLMVQPFPLQTSPLFNNAASPPSAGAFGPLGVVGSAPRQVNIHIHAGTSVAPLVTAMGARAPVGEGAQGEQTGSNGSGNSGTARVLPVRNVIATAVPRPAATASPVSTTGQPSGVSTSHPLDATSLSSAVSEVTSRLRNFVDSMRVESQTPSGPQESSTVADVSSVSVTAGGCPTSSDLETGNAVLSEGVGTLNQKDQVGTHSQHESSCTTEDAGKSTDGHDKLDEARVVPLGLGLGGLQPKTRSKQPKTTPKSGDGESSAAPLAQRQEAAATGRQVLESLASLSSAPQRNGADTRQIPQGVAQVTSGMPARREGSDVVSSVSQLVQNPAFDGILSGLAGQAGMGSANDMRSMFQQFCQNPALMNTINQFAQQVDTDDLQRSFSGMGRGQGQGGGIDLSGMMQQMMPLVSSVLGGGSAAEVSPNMDREVQQQHVNRGPSGQGTSYGEISEVDIQEICRRIAQGCPPRDIFHTMIQTVLTGGRGTPEFVEELSSDEELAKDFMDMLRRDLFNQVRDDYSRGGMS